MESGGFGADVSPTDNTVPIDTERTIAAPRFDNKSVQRARPAVPLTLRGKARTWPLAIVFACVLAGLAGGLLGGVVLMKYQGSKSNSEPTAASTSTQPDASREASPASGEQQSKADSQPSNNQQTKVTQTTNDDAQPSTDEGDADSRGVEAGQGAHAELRSALDGWIAATNARDVGRQITFYAPTVEAFYLSRNASRAAVREEKARLFSRARAVDVRASEPDIRLGRDGRTAVMRFRKRYQIDERGGEVLQELRWRRTGSGWLIVGERDLRVIQ
jgi:ketosteroid isomerase-like protein